MPSQIEQLNIEQINITLFSADPVLVVVIAGLFLLIKHKTAIRWGKHLGKIIIDYYVGRRDKDDDQDEPGLNPVSRGFRSRPSMSYTVRTT